MYGGHILDSAELDVLESAAMAYLSREIPVWFSGSHLNIISRPGNFGNFKLCDSNLLFMCHSCPT